MLAKQAFVILIWLTHRIDLYRCSACHSGAFPIFVSMLVC